VCGVPTLRQEQDPAQARDSGRRRRYRHLGRGTAGTTTNCTHVRNISELSQAWVAHACNPSYSGGRDQEDLGSKPPRKIVQ
jgi:hypothetical protein